MSKRNRKSAARRTAEATLRRPTGQAKQRSSTRDENIKLMRLGEQLDLLTHDRMAQEKTDRKHRASNEPHPDPDLTQWQALNNRLVALVKPLFALTARTPAGLAIQTKAATMACQDLWDIKAETEAPRSTLSGFSSRQFAVTRASLSQRRDDS